MGDDLILRFLNLDHLPELGRLARFPLADHFRARAPSPSRPLSVG